MRKENLTEIERKIATLKQKLLAIGEMRPGSLTIQYKDPKTKSGGFYQISYTHHMKSRTEYVRLQFVPALKKQIITYKTFRNIVETWIDLAIEHSKEKIRLAILKEKG
jgi:hypothetical protein